MAPRLVNGLDIVCAWHQSSYHTENLLLQVLASLYRFNRIIKTMEFRSYKGINVDAFYAPFRCSTRRTKWQVIQALSLYFK